MTALITICNASGEYFAINPDLMTVLEVSKSTINLCDGTKIELRVEDFTNFCRVLEKVKGWSPYSIFINKGSK